MTRSQSTTFAAGAAAGALLVCLSVLFASHPGQPPACQTPITQEVTYE